MHVSACIHTYVRRYVYICTVYICSVLSSFELSRPLWNVVRSVHSSYTASSFLDCRSPWTCNAPDYNPRSPVLASHSVISCPFNPLTTLPVCPLSRTCPISSVVAFFSDVVLADIVCRRYPMPQTSSGISTNCVAGGGFVLLLMLMPPGRVLQQCRRPSLLSLITL